GRISVGALLPREALTLVRGAGHPDASILFALRARLGGVPRDIDVACAIGGNRPAPVLAVSLLNHVPLPLESRAPIVKQRVEHWRGLGRPSWFGFVRTHPCDVDSPTFSKGQVSAPDVADGDGAARLTIHPERVGEVFPVLGTDVEDVAAPWFAGEVDQV